MLAAIHSAYGRVGANEVSVYHSKKNIELEGRGNKATVTGYAMAAVGMRDEEGVTIYAITGNLPATNAWTCSRTKIRG
jgi:hypothetical protein